MNKLLKVMIPIFFIFFAMPVIAISEKDLIYRDRGNRWEGKEPAPVSAPSIELISAIIKYKQDDKKIPINYGVRFFLKKPCSIYMTVRERKNEHYYWLDKIKPVEWKEGVRDFIWDNAVIQYLPLTMNDLGIVVRIDDKYPNITETVAPVIFYHSSPPSQIIATEYSFLIKSNKKQKVNILIYENEKKKVLKEETQILEGLYPIELKINEKSDSEYRIECRESAKNGKLIKIISFCHKAVIK